MASHKITVTRSAQNAQDLGFTFMMVASNGVNMANEIFHMNQRPADPGNHSGPQTADFWGLCTTLDMQNLPANTPNPGQSQYRTAQVTVTYPTQNDADLAWTCIKQDVQGLTNGLDSADRLEISEEFTTT